MNRARVFPLGLTVCLASGLFLGLAPALKAGAQGTPWLPDRQYQEGPGIRVGELELHPGVAIRGGYNNNVFSADGKRRNGVINQKIQGAGILAVTPHLYLTTETTQRAKEGEDRDLGPQQPRFLAFRAGLAATYFHYFIEDAPHNVGADADVFLGIAQGRPVGLDLAAGYLRSVPPFTQNAGTRNAYVFDLVEPKARLRFNSRSQVISAYLGYAPKYTHYESRVFNYLNNIQHGIEAGGAWRFLPSTALVYDANFGLYDFTNRTASDQRKILLSNNKTFKSRLGINGALTNSITFRVLAGYAVGFYNNRELDDFENVVGEAAIGFVFGDHNAEVGYQRDVQTSVLGAWYQTDRGFGRLNFMFAKRFRLGFEVGAGHANYGRLVRRDANGNVEGLGIGGDSSREDVRIDGAVRAEYRATNWLAFMADFAAQAVITDFEFNQTIMAATPGAPAAAPLPDPAGYTAFSVFGGVRASY